MAGNGGGRHDPAGRSATRSFLRWREIPGGVWALGLVSLFMDISSEMIFAILPVYLVTGLGASTLAVGIIEGIAEATAAITKVFSGALSDWLGKRKLLAALGYGLAAITKPVFPLAANLGWIVAARFVDRIGKGIRGAPRDALVADLTPERLRGASFGLRQSLDTIGAVLGPLLALLLMLASSNNFTLVFWVAVLPAIASVAVITFGVRDPPTLKPPADGKHRLTRAAIAGLGLPFWTIVAVAAIFTLARFSEAFLLLRAQSVGVPIAWVPAIYVVMNVVYAASSWPAGVVSDRIGRFTLLIAGFVILIFADLVLALATSIPAVVAGTALWGLHMGLTQGLLAATVADTAPKNLRGTSFGVFNLVTGGATLLASIIAGALWGIVGPGGTFLAGAAFTAVAVVMLSALRRRFRVAEKTAGQP